MATIHPSNPYATIFYQFVFFAIIIRLNYRSSLHIVYVIIIWWSSISIHLDQLEPKVRYRKTNIFIKTKPDQFTVTLARYFLQSTVVHCPTEVLVNIYIIKMFFKSKLSAIRIFVLLYILNNCKYPISNNRYVWF